MEHPTTTPALAPTGHTKQYVFVDEYNRHKRLKVMRACDGCRKRKIRCDGALQNGPWPCGACLRLKLKCLPPSLDQDDDQQSNDLGPGQSTFSFQNTTVMTNSKQTCNQTRPPLVQDWSSTSASSTVSSSTPASASLPPGVVTASQQYYSNLGPRLDPGYADDEYFASTTGPLQFQQNRSVPSLLRSQTELSGSSGDPEEVDAAVKELSEQMGDLAIDHTSAAPYIANEKKYYAEAPTEEEVEVVLPASATTDSIIRIPPEMMPSDERVMDYLGYFFSHIHPYVPVLNRSELYSQWRSSRHLIPPLILEGIFACVARYLEEPIETQKWLALATKHEESFKDSPRVSTIQAMLLLTKARESLPKRGYYYRSWMAVKYMTIMAFDLGLHEHYDQHRVSDDCKLNKSDCMVRKRIWQALFGMEILVGAPQGRTDLAVESETVDFEVSAPSADVDAFEYSTSRRFTYFTRCFRNIKQSSALWRDMRRYKKDWALDPTFVQHNEDLVVWLKQLPSDLQIHYAEDGSPPYLGGDHYVAYLHTYHHLVIIMHHRPQLQAMLERRDPTFKTHLEICLQSATLLCRVQEALIRDFGMHGLQFMLRGINYTIYSVLTCTMLHLAAITSPDPICNSQARQYFTRHMRVLEYCIPSSSGQMQMQINALREAFSADTSKPFELKPSLGLRNPAVDTHSTPPELRHGSHSASAQSTPVWSHLQGTASSKTMSPVSEYGTPFDTMSSHSITSAPVVGYHTNSYQMPATTAYATQTLHQVTSAPSTGYALEPVISNESQETPAWDPSDIFNQWNNAFGGPVPAQQPANVSPTIPDPRMAPTSNAIQTSQQLPVPAQQALYDPQALPQNAHIPTTLVTESLPTVPTVTPMMWQDAFTTAYASGHGQKRYRQEELDLNGYSHFPKRRG